MENRTYNIRMPEKWHKTIEKEAAKKGMKKSEYMKAVIYESIKEKIR